jgi:hypothetical protein
MNLLDNGRILETHEFITKMEFFIKRLKDNPEYYNYLSYEVAKYGSAHTTSTGTKLELAEVGVKYDYVFCEDDTYNELIVKQMALDEQIKERQKFLKTIPVEGLEIVTAEWRNETHLSSEQILNLIRKNNDIKMNWHVSN